MAHANRALARSSYLTAVQIDRALRAAEHAKAIEMDFTHQLVIGWSRTDSDSRVQQKHGRLMICARRWLGRQGVPLVSLWSVEPDKYGSGWHTHTLLHLPRSLVRDFAAMLPRWTDTEALDPATARWAKGKKPEGTVACGGYPEDHGSPIWHLQRRYNDSPRLVHYLLKSEQGQRRHQGRVIGKRIGYSHAISPSAWKRPSAGADDVSAAV